MTADQLNTAPILSGGPAEGVLHFDSKSLKAQKQSSQAEKDAKRRNQLRILRHIAVIAVLDIGLPIAIYYIFQTFTALLIALIVSGVPPLLRMIYTMFRYNRFDYLNALFVIAFALSAILSAINGGVRVALLRDAILTGAIGLCFLATLIPLLTRWFTIYPMTHAVGRQFLEALPRRTWTDAKGVKHEMAMADWMWKEMRLYRRHSYILISLWGLGLLGDFGGRLAMILTGLETNHIIWAGTVMIVVIAVALGLCGAIQFGYLRRKCIQFSQEWKAVHDFSMLNSVSSPKVYGLTSNV